MIAAVRPEADFLRRNEAILNDVEPRADCAIVFAVSTLDRNRKVYGFGFGSGLNEGSNVQYRVLVTTTWNTLVDKRPDVC